MQLTTIEYDAIMQAIDTYKDIVEAHNDGFMSDDTGVTNYSNSDIIKALERVERYIVTANIPN